MHFRSTYGSNVNDLCLWPLSVPGTLRPPESEFFLADAAGPSLAIVESEGNIHHPGGPGGVAVRCGAVWCDGVTFVQSKQSAYTLMGQRHAYTGPRFKTERKGGFWQNELESPPDARR